MTPNELKAAKRISRILRAARKRLGISQYLMCKNIGISQSTLSRMEKGELIPSAHHWIEFCRITAISPNSFVCGFIDTLRINSPSVIRSGSKEGHFTLPSEYSSFRGSMVRKLRIPLVYMENRLSEDAANQWLSSRGVDPDFFVDLNNQLNLKFSYDLFDEMIGKGLLNAGTLDEMMRPVGDPAIHGNLKPIYDLASNREERLKLFVSHAGSYDADFAYKIENETGGVLDISVKPGKHVAEFRLPERLGDSICQFRKKFIEGVSSHTVGPALHVLETQCHYRGAPHCLYRVPIQ